MKKLILTLLLFGLSIGITQAQESNADIHIQQVEKFNNGSFFTSEEDIFGIFLNSPFLSGIQRLAVDANQVARINVVGDRNTAELSQSGLNNIGIINMVGNDNSTTLAQNGNGLFSAINIDGFSNELDVNQTGNHLQNLILLEGTGLNFDVRQNANGIQLTQSGATSIPLSIQRSGQSVPIIIRNN